MTFRTALLILTSAFFSSGLGGCGSSDKPDAPATGQTASGDATASSTNSITFKVDGESVRTTGHNLAVTKMGGAFLLNITTSMHTDPRTINVNLAGTTAAKYNLVENGAGLSGKSGGLYFPDYSNPGGAYTFTSGTFDLTRVDTAAGILEGTFSGTARGEDGKTISITDGKITAGDLKRGVVDVEAMMN